MNFSKTALNSLRVLLHCLSGQGDQGEQGGGHQDLQQESHYQVSWGNLLENCSLQKIRVLKREHPAHQNMKILYFFLFLWVIFALLDPDRQPCC